MRRLAAVGVTVLLLASCGGGDDDDGAIVASEDSTTTTTAGTAMTIGGSDLYPSDAGTATTAAPAEASAATTSTTARRAAATTAPPATTTTAAPATTTTAAPATTTTTAAPAVAHVEVTVSGFAFQPANPSAPAGRIHFMVTNQDSAAHTFTVEGSDVDIALAPNGSGTGEDTFAPGTYGFVCRIHSSMTGTLTVS